MTSSNDERLGLTRFRATHAALDLDVKLLRLGLKAGFNPSQPRERPVIVIEVRPFE